MKKINIPIDQNSYNVYLGHDIFDQLFKLVNKLKLNKNIMLIVDKKLYDIRKHEIDLLRKTYSGKLNILVIQATEKLKDENGQQPEAATDHVCVHLIESGRLKKSDLKRAVAFREQNGGELITLLVRLGLVSERDVALIRDGTVLTSPSSVNMGFYSASSSIDFYFKSIFGGTFWGFSSNLTGSPTSFDLETFTDTNNSLGFGGSIIVQQGIDDWIFHMDDPASVDDDDNDFVVRVHVEPTSAIPVPPAIWLFGSGLIGLIGLARRKT